MDEAIGSRLVEAIAAQDESAIAACFAPDAELRALVPRGLRERSGAQVPELVASWFADATELDLLASSVDRVEDRLHVAYRFHAVEEGLSYLVEQQLFCTLADGKIAHADLLCSGFRPRGDGE